MYSNNSITALNDNSLRKQRLLNQTITRDNNSPVNKTITRVNTRKFKCLKIGFDKGSLQDYHALSKKSFIESMYHTRYKYLLE